MESKSVTNNENIPGYVIDWVRFCKKHGKPLSYALGTTFFQNFILEKYPSSGSEYLWIRFPEHEEQLAAFWLEEKAPEMKKIGIWYESFDDYSFDGYETIEVPVDATDAEIEKAAKETVFEHLNWGYEEVTNERV